MKPWLQKAGIAFGALLGVVLVALLAAVLFALVGYRRVWDVPLPHTRSSTDPAVIARGEYLVNGPAHCADCHSAEADRQRMFRGEIVPLTGGPGETTFLGSWTAPNLTPDSITGIGSMTDGQLARVFRTGVNREGRIALPFKDAFANLAEEDLVAILSYLRTLEPAPGVAPDKRINLLGKITLTYFLRPYSPTSTPPARLKPEVSAGYGEYLANTVGRCESCHTPRNLNTGEFLGPPFSGGFPFQSRERPELVYVSPNLTPDTATGYVTSWTEDEFVERFQAGARIGDSPMPWGSYRRMTGSDLRAIYRYLQSLDPVHRANGPIVQRAEEFDDRGIPPSMSR